MRLSKAILEKLDEVKCYGCGKSIFNDNYVEIGGKVYCLSCAAFVDSGKLEENFGDSTDYSEKIKKLVKQWWKENADLGIRLFKGSIDVDARYTDDEFHKPIAYKVTMNAFWVEIEDYAEEIGHYVSDRIPSIEYVKFTHNKDESSEEYEDINIYFKQNQEVPDFGSEFESDKLKEGYSLGDDSESYEIFEKNTEKLNSVLGYFISKGIPVLTSNSDSKVGIRAQISEDSIYYAIIDFIGFEDKYLGQNLKADGYGDDHIIIDIDDLVSRKQLVAESLLGVIER